MVKVSIIIPAYNSDKIIRHSEKYTNLIVVNYNFPRYDSVKWGRGEL